MGSTQFWNSGIGIIIKWIALLPSAITLYSLGSILTGILVYLQMLLFGEGEVDIIQFASSSNFDGASGYISGIYYLFFLRFPPCSFFFLTSMLFFGTKKAPFVFLILVYIALVIVAVFMSIVRFEALYPDIETFIRSFLELIIPLIAIIYIWYDSYKEK